jgi:hypothetical protein
MYDTFPTVMFGNKVLIADVSSFREYPIADMNSLNEFILRPSYGHSSYVVVDALVCCGI